MANPAEVDNTIGTLDTINPQTGEVTFSTDTAQQTIAALANGQVNDKVFTTITGTDMKSRLVVANALTSSEPISEHFGETINLVEVVAQATDYAVVDAKNVPTGEREPGIRLVLVDESGKGYHAASKSLFRDVVNNILGVLPETSKWGGPVPIKVTEEGKKPNAYYKLSFA